MDSQDAIAIKSLLDNANTQVGDVLYWARHRKGPERGDYWVGQMRRMVVELCELALELDKALQVFESGLDEAEGEGRR